MTKLASEPNNENKRPTDDSKLKVSNQQYTPIKSATFKSNNTSNATKKPTRHAIQQHIDFIQRKKRRKQLSLLKRVLIQEEFEDNFVKLNSAESSDSDSDKNDSMDEIYYQRKFATNRRYKTMRIYSHLG